MRISDRVRERSNRLHGAARDWWGNHGEDLIELTDIEIREVLEALREGDTGEARAAIASRMKREVWVAYRDGTTARLRGLAAKRAATMRALRALGIDLARVIGAALLPP